MTDLDTLDLFAVPPEADRPARPPRPCAHPRAYRRAGDDGSVYCGRCNRVFDPARTRSGRSARRLGADQERRIERVYGPTKIGERGDPVDHLGRLGKYQSKATRTKPPAVFRTLDRMDGLYGERVPILVLSFVRTGVPVEDYIVVRGRDWLALHGRDEQAAPLEAYDYETEGTGGT